MKFNLTICIIINSVKLIIATYSCLIILGSSVFIFLFRFSYMNLSVTLAQCDLLLVASKSRAKTTAPCCSRSPTSLSLLPYFVIYMPTYLLFLRLNKSFSVSALDVVFICSSVIACYNVLELQVSSLCRSVEDSHLRNHWLIYVCLIFRCTF